MPKLTLLGLVSLALSASLGGCGAPRLAATVPVGSATATALGVVSPPTLAVPAAPLFPPAPPLEGNDASLFVGPAETLPALEREIASAQRSIYLETFNFGTGYAERLAPQLIAKAASGVEVRVLIDFVGSRFLKGYGDLVAKLRAGHVDVQVYMPFAFLDPTHHQSFNITHRKVYLFDGKTALVGGVNLASPFDTTTQDLLIRWQGPVLGPLFTEFGHDWQHASKTTLGQKALVGRSGAVNAQVLVTSPAEGRDEIRDAVFARVDGARQSICIEQQYLWDDELVGRLAAAASRGVSVRILLPGAEQESIQRTCNFGALNQLVKAGASAHLYQGATPTAHLHTKYFSIDDQWASVGSCNGDTRSLLDNQELDIATTDAGLVSQLRGRLFERDWQSCSTPYVVTQPGWVAKRFMSILEILDYYM